MIYTKINKISWRKSRCCLPQWNSTPEGVPRAHCAHMDFGLQSREVEKALTLVIAREKVWLEAMGSITAEKTRRGIWSAMPGVFHPRFRNTLKCVQAFIWPEPLKEQEGQKSHVQRVWSGTEKTWWERRQDAEPLWGREEGSNLFQVGEGR